MPIDKKDGKWGYWTTASRVVPVPAEYASLASTTKMTEHYPSFVSFSFYSGDGNSNFKNTANATAFLQGSSLLLDGAKGVNNFFQESNLAIKAAAFQNNIPSTRIDNILKSTKTTKVFIKWAGRTVIVLSALISISEGIESHKQGDIAGVQRAGMDLAVGIGCAFIGGIPGIVIYGGYMLVMQTPPGISSQHPHGVFQNDNTYVAQPVLPGF